MNLEKLCTQTQNIAREVGDYIRKNRNAYAHKEYEIKGKNDFVTDIDKTSEEKIISGLSKILPIAGFIAEEQTKKASNQELTWVIDPIDGTTNFIHGLYPHAISIALLQENKPILAVIYEVGFDECFYTYTGAPAYCNGKEIRVSGNKDVASSLIATGFPYYDYGRIEPFQKTLEYFMKHSQGIRRLGSAATDLAYVACGRFDAFYEYGLKPWDVAAGILLVEQAGGKTSDFSLQNNHIFGGEIIAANTKVYEEFSSIISSIMTP